MKTSGISAPATGLIRGWAERLDGWVGERSLTPALPPTRPMADSSTKSHNGARRVDLDASERGIDFVVAEAQVRLDRFERRTRGIARHSQHVLGHRANRGECTSSVHLREFLRERPGIDRAPTTIVIVTLLAEVGGGLADQRTGFAGGTFAAEYLLLTAATTPAATGQAAEVPPSDLG